MQDNRNEIRGERTLAVHAGEMPDPATRASAPNIVMSSTYVVDEAAGFSAHDRGEDSYLYTRWSNPTVDMLSQKIAALEETEACTCFASGMAAAAAIFMSELSAGDRLVISDTSYAGVAELVQDTLPRFGIDVVPTNMADLTAVGAALAKGATLVHIETPVNPLIRLTDIEAVCRLAHAAGARVSCDSTFASPMVTKPAALGVDYVMHSLTKYIGGHGDAMGGAVAGRKDLIDALTTEASVHYGGVLSPFNAWLIARGAATLPIRMRAHSETAMKVAEWLEGHPSVSRVLYPGLESHPQHELARRQMKQFSGMLAFQVGSSEQGAAIAERMMNGLKIVHYAVSLGHHRSLIFWMPTDDLMRSSFRLSGDNLTAYRDMAGDGIFRLSVGLEDAEDIIADLDSVL